MQFTLFIDGSRYLKRFDDERHTTQEPEQAKIDATAQELTGVWTGQPAPQRPAPTQELGAALFAEPDIEGFCTISAQVPYFQVLVVFPEKLQPGSLVTVSPGHRGTRHDCVPKSAEAYREARWGRPPNAQ